MKLDQVLQNYALHDGQTLSFYIDFAESSCTTRLQVRRYLKKHKYENCKITLQFMNVTTIDIAEEFGTGGNYSDITVAQLPDGTFYISTDPYGNTGVPHDQDNNVIIAARLVFINENNEMFEIT